MKFNFSVDEIANEQVRIKAVQDMKRTIKMAKIAEKALKSIEEKGYYEGRVAVITQNPVVRVYKKEIPINRSLAPDFKDLKIILGEIDRYGRSRVPVHVSGTIFSRDDTGKLVEGSDQIGYVSMNKGGYSFSGFQLGVSYRSYYPACKLYSKYHRLSSLKTVDIMSKSLGHSIVGHLGDQFTNSMREKVPVWLKQEGVAERLLLELLDTLKVAEVMST
jgi:hypothetical protein